MSLRSIRIVLTRPLYGGNVGAVCRAMMNMGLEDLCVVKPTLGLDEGEVRKMALGAYPLYENRRTAETLREAVADCTVVAGASAREGLYRSHAKTIREWAPEFVAATADGTVALVFGPEDDGLNNEEIGLCNRLVEIPSTSAYRSLNLSQAVMVCAYELYLVGGDFELEGERSAVSTSDQRERMLDFWDRALRNTGFMDNDTGDHMMQGVRRIFSRGTLTDKDVRILMGIARQADWCATELKKYRDFT